MEGVGVAIGVTIEGVLVGVAVAAGVGAAPRVPAAGEGAAPVGVSGAALVRRSVGRPL